MGDFVRDDAHDVGPHRGDPQRRERRRRRVPGARVRAASTSPTSRRPRSPATRSAPTARSSRSTCRASTPTCTTATSTSPRSRSSRKRWFPRAYFNSPAEERRTPRPRRHPRVDPRAALLPPRGLRRRPRPVEPSRAAGLAADRGERVRLQGVVDSSSCQIALGGRHMVGIAQLVERLVVVQEVAGSSPVTHPKSCSQRKVRSRSVRTSIGAALVELDRRSLRSARRR